MGSCSHFIHYSAPVSTDFTKYFTHVFTLFFSLKALIITVKGHCMQYSRENVCLYTKKALTKTLTVFLAVLLFINVPSFGGVYGGLGDDLGDQQGGGEEGGSRRACRHPRKSKNLNLNRNPPLRPTTPPAGAGQAWDENRGRPLLTILPGGSSVDHLSAFSIYQGQPLRRRFQNNRRI